MTDATAVDRFTWERALRRAPDVTGIRVAVLLTLATYMDANGAGARPPQTTLADDCGLGERAVRAHLSWAVANGWLKVVQRGHHIVGTDRAVASLYRATAPQPASVRRLSEEATTGTPEPVVDPTTGTSTPDVKPPQPAPKAPTTGTPVPPTTDHVPTAATRVPYEEPETFTDENGVERAVHRAPLKPEPDPPAVDVTPKRILTEMCRRKLAVAREAGVDWAPPAGCDRRREDAWLRSEFDAMHTTHGFALDHLLATERGRDPDWYVWKLDPTLAKRNWQIPSYEETQARLTAQRAERAECERQRAAMSPEERRAMFQVVRDDVRAKASA